MWEAFKDALSLAASFMGWKQKRQELENSPEMTANAAAATDQQMQDDAAKAIAQRNEEEIKRRLAGQ